MQVAGGEQPEPRPELTPQEIAEFAEWGAEFIDFLHSTPTAEKDDE